MDPITQQTVLAAAGAAKGDPVYVDDVFSTYLYKGNKDEWTTNPPATQNIVNNIDNVENKGLVWQKARSYSGSQGFSWSHYLTDTERGATKVLNSNSSGGEATENAVISFNTNGFTAGSFNLTNNDKAENVAWNFRAAPGFFDVVTYTGNGTAGRTVAHDLGSVPGMIIVKCLDVNEPWCVYHRSLGNTKYLSLSETSTGQTSTLRWNDTNPTSSVFTVGTDPNVNQNTKNYVAYIFAHDDAQFGTDGDESIIKCGSYTGNAGVGPSLNLGFEPQWVLIKNTSVSQDWTNWLIFDNMRGVVTGVGDILLQPNTTAEEGSTYTASNIDLIDFTSTGFNIDPGGSQYTLINSNGNNYIYMAIRRPHKPPEVGTEVFAIDTRGGTSPTPPTYNSGFPVDVSWARDITTSNWQVKSRLTGEGQILTLNSTAAEYNNPSGRVTFDRMDGTGTDTGVDSANYSWMFKRAPGFFDVVTYTGNGYGGGNTPNSINHNLGVAPEMIITKNRLNAGYLWLVYNSGLSSINSALVINGSNAEQTISGIWNNAAPTSTQFFLNLGENNYNNHSYIAYLFATLPGISKVGSYSGTGSVQNIDCGFTNGARFVIIKKTSDTGNWNVYDTKRGLVSGNDQVLNLDNNAAQASYDSIDPHSSGFTLTTGPVVNANGSDYIFLAIA